MGTGEPETQGHCLFTQLGLVQHRRLRLGQTRKKVRGGGGLLRIKPFTHPFVCSGSRAFMDSINIS